MERNRGRDLFLLLVEEDPSYTELIRKSLAQNSQYSFRVDQAVRVEEALEKIQKNHYHLLLVKEKLNGRPGLELLDEIQKAKLNVPFILLTDIRDEQTANAALQRGVADLIVKSESQFHDLAAKLEASFEKYGDTHAGFCRPDILERLRKRTPPREESVDPASQDPAYRDELTGIYNHSYFQERFVQEFSAAVRYNYPISCLFLDLDHFKRINEKHGYPAGDQILRDSAALLLDNCRLSDVIARYGGEEFVILLPHAEYKSAAHVAKRLVEIFDSHTFRAGDREVKMTVSIGVAAFPEDRMEKRFELLSFASQAAARSKAAGRNRMTCYCDIPAASSIQLPELKISEDRILNFQRRLGDITDLARNASMEASRTLIAALEAKDRVTAGHSAQTAKYAAHVAELMGMGPEDCEVVRHGALLHDVGKLSIPDEILLKEGKLTFEEYEIIKQHPYLGYQILKPIKFLQEESQIVLYHHEWFNGRGYPCGLKGNAIPLGARIVAVIDAYDTIRMAGFRYKATASAIDSVNELISCSGTQFDPVVVKAFIAVLIKKGEIKKEDCNIHLLDQKILKIAA